MIITDLLDIRAGSCVSRPFKICARRLLNEQLKECAVVHEYLSPCHWRYCKPMLHLSWSIKLINTCRKIGKVHKIPTRPGNSKKLQSRTDLPCEYKLEPETPGPIRPQGLETQGEGE